MSDLAPLIAADAAEKIAAANKVAETVQANTVDENKLVHEIRDNRETTDENLKKFHAYIDRLDDERFKAVEKVDAYIRDNLMPKRDENVDIDALKKSHDEARKAAKRALDFLRDQFSSDEEFEKFCQENNIPALKSVRGGTTGTGAGTPRPRIVGGYIDGEDVSKDGNVNFTILAAALAKKSGQDVEVRDLQSAAFEAAGTTDLKSLNGRGFEYSYTVGDKNYMIKIVPAVPGAKKDAAEASA